MLEVSGGVLGAGLHRLQGVLAASLRLVGGQRRGRWLSSKAHAFSHLLRAPTCAPAPPRPNLPPAAKDVRGGTVQMVVHYAGLPIWTQVDSLCDKADCPIKKGPTEVGGAARAVAAAAAAECCCVLGSAVACPRATVPQPPSTACLPPTSHYRLLLPAAALPLRPPLPCLQVRYSQLFPSITPPGSYTVTLNGHSGDDSLFCVTVAFQVSTACTAHSRSTVECSAAWQRGAQCCVGWLAGHAR